MIGPLRQRWLRPFRQKGQSPHGKLRPRRHAVARPDACHALADLDHPCTELMAEKLHGGFGLEPALDRLVSQSRDAEGELGLGDARLDAQRLGHHVPRPADRLGHVVEPHVAETVKSPGFHDRLLTQANEFLQRVAVGGTAPSSPPADHVTSPT